MPTWFQLLNEKKKRRKRKTWSNEWKSYFWWRLSFLCRTTVYHPSSSVMYLLILCYTLIQQFVFAPLRHASKMCFPVEVSSLELKPFQIQPPIYFITPRYVLSSSKFGFHTARAPSYVAHLWFGYRLMGLQPRGVLKLQTIATFLVPYNATD